MYVVTVVPKKLLPTYCRLRLVMTGVEPGTCIMYTKKLLPWLRLTMTGDKARYVYVVLTINKLLLRLRLTMTGAEPSTAEPGTCMLYLHKKAVT